MQRSASLQIDSSPNSTQLTSFSTRRLRRAALPPQQTPVQKIEHQLLIMIAAFFEEVAVPGPGNDVKFAWILAAMVEFLDVFRLGVGIVFAGQQQHGCRGQVRHELPGGHSVPAAGPAVFGKPDDAAGEEAEPARIFAADARAKRRGSDRDTGFQNDSASQPHGSA